MYFATITLAFALSWTLPITAQESGVSCDSDKQCPGNPGALICVKPNENASGSCQIACSLTTNVKPCPLSSGCKSLPQVSTMMEGYCADLVSCGGFAGVACPNNAECLDDPRDDCKPSEGDADCVGVCAGNSSSTLKTRDDPYVNKACEVNPCPAEYQCTPNGKDLCDPDRGWTTCSRLCTEERKCDSRGLAPCSDGETCVHSPNDPCAGAEDCPGVCRSKD